MHNQSGRPGTIRKEIPAYICGQGSNCDRRFFCQAETFECFGDCGSPGIGLSASYCKIVAANLIAGLTSSAQFVAWREKVNSRKSRFNRFFVCDTASLIQHRMSFESWRKNPHAGISIIACRILVKFQVGSAGNCGELADDKFKSRRSLVIAGVVVSIIAVGLAGFLWSSHSNGARATGALATAKAVNGNIEKDVVASGTIYAVNQVNVGAQVSGQLKSLKVALNQIVHKGELIAEIDSLTQQYALQNAEANVKYLQAQLLSAKASARQAELEFERQKTMFAKDAAAKADYDTAEANLGTTRAQIGAVEAQLEQGKISVDTARVNLGYTKIVAPMDGKVVAIVTQQGATVNANQSAPIIIRLADLSTVTVKAQISEADVINVKRGQHLYFTILGDADKKYQATLREVESADTVSSDATTTTTTTSSSSAVYYYGWFDVPNPDGRLRIGMTATATIVLDELKNVLTIPAAALGQKDASGRYKVRVASADGRVEERAVKIGLNNNAVAQVFDGVREGENVVIAEASATPAAKGSGGMVGGGMPMGGGPPGP